MRRVTWCRIAILCLLSGIVAAVVNIAEWIPRPEQCTCDCSVAVAQKETELKLRYEVELERRKGGGIDEHSEPLEGKQVADNPSKRQDGGDERRQDNGAAQDVGESSHRLAVIVPFRNRHEEMYEFVPHIHQFLSRQSVRHEIWVVNQEDTHR